MTNGNLVFFTGAVETLSFFSIQLADAYRLLGYNVLFQDINSHNIQALRDFCMGNTTTLITFNFIGISGEEDYVDGDGVFFWDYYNVRCINIIVDHPMYYYRQLQRLPHDYAQVCIDIDHLYYMKRYYKNINNITFLPLAGTPLKYPVTPAKNRPYDIFFCGNYNTPESFERHMVRNGEEYRDFYHGIIDDLIANPDTSIDTAIENHLIREFGTLTDEQICLTTSSMIFIDLYIRFYFRGLVFKTLANTGLRIYTYGNGLDKIDCTNSRITYGGLTTSAPCLEAMNNAKITLNVMPWFKNGAHDRVFNSMLNNSVCLTDSSRYLDTVLSDKTDCLIYPLNDMDKLADTAMLSSENNEYLDSIICNAYSNAIQEHTWAARAESLIPTIQYKR